MWWLLRRLLVGLLVCSAIVKVIYAQQMLHSGGLLSSRWSIASAVGAEFLIAGLIWTCRSTVAHGVAVFAFALLGIVASVAWLSGSNCNCFGPRTISGVPALVDFACLLGLLLTAKSVHASHVDAMHHSGVVASVERRRPKIRSSMHVFAVALVSLVSGAAAWSAAGPTTVRPGEIVTWFGENLVGHPFPLLRFPEIDAVTPSEGRRLFILLRPDCEHCHDFARHWNQGPPEGIDVEEVVGVAVMPSVWTIMPGVVSATAVRTPDGGELKWTDVSEPFIATPMLIAVDGRRVNMVVSGDDALTILDSPSPMTAMFSASAAE